MTQTASRTSPRRIRWLVAGGVALAIGSAAVVLGSKHTVAPRVVLSRAELQVATSFPFSDYDRLLRRFVDTEGRGLVDYRGLRRERLELDRVLAFVAQAGPSSRPELYPTENHRKAFFIAAYNASVWRNVIDRAPRSDIGAVRLSFFYSTRYVIDGAEINLKDLEDQRVRAAFHDARVHFALNCASAGCPRLPNEAFTPERLDAQLDREARRFCNEARNVRVDTAARRVVLSKIFEWYAQDFAETERSRGRADGDRITFINRYRAEGDQIPPGYTVEFVDYDWTINARRPAGQPPSS
ncbi:MAG: DUF547 domain-containing protein [Deltaproteobacteria bacterium]|nr:DUF547 domain-containing protein [Deltaproteobacteria bacterium]